MIYRYYARLLISFLFAGFIVAVSLSSFTKDLEFELAVDADAEPGVYKIPLKKPSERLLLSII